MKQKWIFVLGFFIITFSAMAAEKLKADNFYTYINDCRYNISSSANARTWLEKSSSTNTDWGPLQEHLSKFRTGQLKAHLSGDQDGRAFVNEAVVVVLDNDNLTNMTASKRTELEEDYLPSFAVDICKLLIGNQANVHVVDMTGKSAVQKQEMWEHIKNGLKLESVDPKVKGDVVSSFFLSNGNAMPDGSEEYYTNMDRLIKKANARFVQNRIPSSFTSNETPGSCPNPVQDAAEPLPEKTQIPLSDLTKALVDATSKKSSSSNKEAAI